MRLGVFQRLDMIVDLYRNDSRLVRNVATDHQHDTKFANGMRKAENRTTDETGAGERYRD